MKDILPAIAAFITAAIGLAIVSVLVSKQAQTPAVLQSAGGALSGIIGCAVSPVSGGTCGGGQLNNNTSWLSIPNIPSSNLSG